MKLAFQGAPGGSWKYKKPSKEAFEVSVRLGLVEIVLHDLSEFSARA